MGKCVHKNFKKIKGREGGREDGTYNLTHDFTDWATMKESYVVMRMIT